MLLLVFVRPFIDVYLPGNRVHETLQWLQATEQHLAQRSADRPRIIIVGGSNAVTGLQAAVLEAKLGLPAANFGLMNEADDYRRTLALARHLARPGDTVVYSSRMLLGIDLDDLHSGWTLPVPTTQVGIWPTSRENIYAERSAIGIWFGPSAPSDATFWTEAHLRDSRGDYLGCKPGSSLGSSVHAGASLPDQLLASHATLIDRLSAWHLGHLHEAAMAQLAQLSDELAKRRVKLLLRAPPIMTSSADLPRWHGYFAQMRSRYPFAASAWQHPEQILINDGSLFCSQLHPTPQAARLFSEQLAGQLQLMASNKFTSHPQP
ncbi:hypothetical protein [Chitinimonas sp.]|uniref:hypothetical protein n=1 Tax=Chitinimonas sp. TaxID=1934313 RepID=UPI0035B1D5B7